MTMSPSRIAAGCLAALALYLTPGVQAAEPESKSKPNILFFAVDDLRTEFGAYGDSYIKSPNLDRLAARGRTFLRAYCQQAVCSPSRSSLLTGTRPDTTKVWDLETHFRKALPDVVTLPQFFKQHGYFVQGMGKIYHGGFDDPPSWSVPWKTPAAEAYALPESKRLVKESHEQAVKKGLTGKALQRAGRGPAFEAADVPDDAFKDGKVAEMAIEALQARSQHRDQPFFLAVGFARPHLPFVSPKKYWDLYDPSQIALAPNPFRPRGAPEYAVQEGGELRAYADIPHGHLPDDLARQLKHGYYASISYMDAQLGKVLDELDRLGLKDNTIVVLWGDHGWKLGEHDAWCKHTNVELDANAPLIVAAPGKPAPGKTTDALVEFVDIYPTLVELACFSPPSHLEGTSFAPILDAPDRPWKPAAFSQYPRSVAGRRLMGYSMRTDRYRFTRWVARNNPSQVDAVELYDHQTDPQENQNIANDPANADLVARLTEQWNKGWRGAVAP